MQILWKNIFLSLRVLCVCMCVNVYFSPSMQIRMRARALLLHSLQWAYQFELYSQFAFILTLFDAASTFNAAHIYIYILFFFSAAVLLFLLQPFSIFIYVLFAVFSIVSVVQLFYSVPSDLELAFFQIKKKKTKKNRQRARFSNTVLCMSSSWFKQPVND